MRLAVVCWFALGTVVATCPLEAQHAAQRVQGRILGVFDEASGDPIPGAEVIDLFTGGEARTEGHGLVELSQFTERNDSAAVRIRKLGFADTSLIVKVGKADSVPVEIDLNPAPVDLPALISHAVSAPTLEERRLTEYEDRRKMGFGHFIDGPELRKYVDNLPFVDYLSGHLPALTVISNPRDGSEYLSSGEGQCAGRVFSCRGGSGQCPIALYIDGVAIYKPGGGGGPMPDFRDYKSENFVAVEWYPSGATVPAEYGGTGAQCGVMLLWRRYN